MPSNTFRSLLLKSGLAASLLLASGAASAQQQVNLTAGPDSLTLPDGTVVPMWGYSCGAPVSGSTAACAKLNPGATGWSPVVITVPWDPSFPTSMTISLTNNLVFGGSAIPTSIVIVGQLGGGLGTTATSTKSPDHSNAQGATTWPIAGGPGGTPPSQPDRVQSFDTEFAATGVTPVPPQVASGSGVTWSNLRPGTYLFESGTHPSIQGPMGLYGILIVTAVPAGAIPGTAYPGVSYSADVPLLLSEIDSVQNNAVSAAVNTPGFQETMVWSGQPGGCGDPTSVTYHQCYPPAVNYTPLYYLFNGVAFNKTNVTASVFQANPAGVSGNVLVRLVNAGLHMHVPSIVGAMAGTAPGVSLIAEDGNPLPGNPRVQSEVFLAAGKTYDVMVSAPACSPAPCTPAALTLPVFDRQLSLSANSSQRDGGMLAYIGVNGGAPPAAASLANAVARNDAYNGLFAGQTFTVSDPSKGVIANDTNVYGVTLLDPAASGTVTLNRDGTFIYAPLGTATSDSFTYCANGTVTAGACSSNLTATVALGPSSITNEVISCTSPTYSSSMAGFLAVKAPGVLAFCTDSAGLPLKVDLATVAPGSLTVVPAADGGFTAALPTPGAGQYSFTFQARSASGKPGPVTTVNVSFPAGSGLAVTVLDGGDKTTTISDYRWIIEEDRTFYVDPNCTTNPLPSGCPNVVPDPAHPGQSLPLVFGTNFHTSHMPVVAQGCTGPLSCEGGQTRQQASVVCDVGNGDCRPDPTQSGQTPVLPSQVALDPTKRYYISVLPGDAANPFNAGYAGPPDCKTTGHCGHGMGGAPIAAGQTAVTVLTQPSPYPTAKLTVFVFEDDFPLNGEHDAGGGIDVLSPNEPGLGSFQITLFDDAGGTGDATGQPTYNMFNMPLTNSLAGTIDPLTGFDACPISPVVTNNVLTGDGTQKGIVGMIVTCPTYESDGVTLSPMAGQAVVDNLYPGRYGVVATPAADRIARGEEWLQTNTLDGQKAHDSFMRIGEPAFFQEFGPAGYHVSIGFANPAIINARLAGLCPPPATPNAPPSCPYTVTGHVTTARMSRVPDERLFGSGDRTAFGFTQCYVSMGDPDGADFAFTKCNNDDGSFTFTGIPSGNWKITIFDQWNDQIVDGISFPVGLSGSNTAVDLGEIASHQWQANIYTRTFLDDGNGVSDKDANGNDTEAGLPLVATNIRFRDGSYSNFNNTDLNGYAGFNEVFPLFSWYVIETDSTRFKTTGVHVVYDTGGPVDCTPGDPSHPCSSSSPTCNGTASGACGLSAIAQNLANTFEAYPLPANLSVPGAVYCAEGADCAASKAGFKAGTPKQSALDNHSSGRIDPPTWFGSYAWQGFSGQNSFLEFGKKPYATGENGGIHGHVVYASTRPFDDPQLLLQLSWEPLVPGVTVNLYQEGVATDGITPTLTLVDTTKTSSFDDWAQGFRSNGIPNMNCPGQAPAPNGTTPGDPFFFSLQNQPQYLDFYNSQHGGSPVTALPYNAQYKCYDGMHNWNQLQPAPYDGMYSFPSVAGYNPTNGKPSGTNCTICTGNPDTTDPYRSGQPMLPAGKYVVEVVVPPGYELVKEEDKNILIGDNYIAPVTQQFGGLSNILILPDQAQVAAAYNRNNAQNPTQTLGRMSSLSSHEGDTGSVESYWPCVGATRQVPDYISLFPQSKEVAPFAGAMRPLCDRKEVNLTDQSAALAKFYIFSSTHVAAHYTGVITDDFTAEFDPFSPQFGEKFAPAYLPVSVKDWTGNEISRVYADQWGAYNGLNYSTWEVNPPNPTGYGPTMMIMCMNDAGGGITPDPLFQAGYSQFCYHLPFMPGQTGYFDTPVVPVSAFSEGYNHPDCNYPDATPAISTVVGDAPYNGPWVSQSGSGHPLTITALGDQQVDNYGYSGPSFSTATYPWAKQKVTRHFGFGATQGTGTVTIGGRHAHVVSWSDTQIVVNVPDEVPDCNIRQQAQYGGSTAQCGELVVTAGNGKRSVDTVTVTIGGKTPTVLGAGQTIQSAIDAAAPGDLIIVPPGKYSEMVLMWKPVRLQGVGAASTIIDANTHPAGKLNPWRRQVVCLFGLALDGTPISGTHPYDPSGTFSCDPKMQFSVDRLPLEATVGWTALLNGNLAEQLIEPTIMGAYEGAGITVLSKGVAFPAGSQPFASDVFPTGTTLLTSSDCTSGTGGTNPYPSNFWCNPSRIDGLSVTNSSQGGGGILVHGWGHNLEIANNRVKNNQGTLSGGITVGQGEHPDVYLQGSGTNTVPGSCQTSETPNQSLPFCFDLNVNVHNNFVIQNSSLGDELFSSTPAGAGGATFCNGSDYYKFNYNWVCGNMSTGDGGGVAHIGFSYNGDIEHNQILFNQSTNPTITTNGGGLLVMGAPDQDPPCATNNDKDCLSPPNTIPPSDGTGPHLVINANLIMGNSADSGSGGGLRLQHVNGTDVINLPNGAQACPGSPNRRCLWNSVTVTNNIIANNVAGWDGGGVSLLDALVVNIVNNTIISNDSTASSGVLFGSLFAPLASTPNEATNVTCSPSGLPGSQRSCPQVAGLVSVTNSAVLRANLPPPTGQGHLVCPPDHGSGGACRDYSVPILYNNVIWENRSFDIGVGGFGTGTQNQQRVVKLYDAFTGGNNSLGTEAPSQSTTGACVSPVSYWEIGVRGDTGPTNHALNRRLNPLNSLMTSISGYDSSNTTSNPAVISQYCNGSRVPPELGSMGFQVPPGTNETQALPTPVFSLTPSATVDEGNNWINLRWGPLSLTNPVNGTTLANYGLTSTSGAINQVLPSETTYAAAPPVDFYGNPRPSASNPAIDIGAVEFQSVAVPPTTPTLTSISPNTGARGSAVPVTLTGTNLTGATAVTVSGGGGISVSNLTVVNSTTVTATFTISSTTTPGNRTIRVVTSSGTSNGVTFTLVNPPAPTLTSVTPTQGARGTSVSVTLTGTHLLTTSAVSVSGSRVSVSNINVVNDTTVTATFTIQPNAATTARNVTVTTLGGPVTRNAAFTVN
jgi:hypothetical protein